MDFLIFIDSDLQSIWREYSTYNMWYKWEYQTHSKGKLPLCILLLRLFKNEMPCEFYFHTKHKNKIRHHPVFLVFPYPPLLNSLTLLLILTPESHRYFISIPLYHPFHFLLQSAQPKVLLLQSHWPPNWPPHFKPFNTHWPIWFF